MHPRTGEWPTWRVFKKALGRWYRAWRVPGDRRQHYYQESRWIVEGLIGRRLDPSEPVHHRDLDKANNAPSNLVLLASHAEHIAEHAEDFRPWIAVQAQRRREQELRDHPNSRICGRCRVEKPLDDFGRNPRNWRGRQAYCRPCMSAYGAAWRAKQQGNEAGSCGGVASVAR